MASVENVSADISPIDRPTHGRLPKKLKSALAPCFENPDKVMFLDIETTGLSHYYDEITIVGWAQAGGYHTYVRGDDPNHLLECASKANALVTFNGIRFDKKFLIQEHPEIRLPAIHIDLMYLCRRVGLTGGQKAIENQLELNFRDNLNGIDGFAAVLLWHQYVRGDVESLRLLIEYNRADVSAMGAILDRVLKCFDLEEDLFFNFTGFAKWSSAELSECVEKSVHLRRNLLGRAPNFDEVFGSSIEAGTRVVGIDLTGSEKRATGWCLLDDSSAVTSLISTDDDLFQSTIDARPKLVSIDSPLCLPFGRQTVFDDDPTRDEFGIMRECERELKRRGVNVYPSLLPSMQKLTARGILLADRFRRAGVPVIESYPGAAQDIMRIPRKGAGVEWLRTGLSEFGISGSFMDGDASHDELDAITSAIVGLFHLAGMSEELGAEHETPLIVPDTSRHLRPMVIGVSGPIAAGKTTVSKFLEDAGFAYTRFSLIIDEMLEEKNLELNRSTRQGLGEEINANGRQYELAQRTLKRVEGANFIVVDGLRFPEDHAHLVEMFGNAFFHIYIDSDREVRRERFLTRGEKNPLESDSDFDIASASVVESKVEILRSIASAVILNNADMTALECGVLSLIQMTFEGQKCQYQSSLVDNLALKARAR